MKKELTIEEKVQRSIKADKTRLKKKMALESLERYKEANTELKEQAKRHHQEYEKLNYMYEDLKNQYYKDTGKEPLFKSFTQIEIDTLKKENEKLKKELLQTEIEIKNDPGIEEIKEQLQTENETLRKKLSRAGTGRRRNSSIPDEEIIKMKAAGKSFRKIEAETGVSIATISRVIKLSLKQQKGTKV